MLRVDRSPVGTSLQTETLYNRNTLPEEDSAWTKVNALGSQFFSRIWSLPKSLGGRVGILRPLGTFLKVAALALLAMQGAYGANYTSVPSTDFATQPGITKLYGTTLADGNIDLAWENGANIHGLVVDPRIGQIVTPERQLNTDTTRACRDVKICALPDGGALHVWQQFPDIDHGESFGQFTNASLDAEGSEQFFGNSRAYPFCAELDNQTILFAYENKITGFSYVNIASIYPNRTLSGSTKELTLRATNHLDCIGLPGGGFASTGGQFHLNNFYIEDGNGSTVFEDTANVLGGAPNGIRQKYSRVILTDDNTLAWAWYQRGFSSVPTLLRHKVTDISGNEIKADSPVSSDYSRFSLDDEPFGMAPVNGGFIIGYSGDYGNIEEDGIFLRRFYSNGTERKRINLLNSSYSLSFLIPREDGYNLFFLQNDSLHGVRFNDQDEPIPFFSATSESPSTTSALSTTSSRITTAVSSTFDSLRMFLSSMSPSQSLSDSSQSSTSLSAQGSTRSSSYENHSYGIEPIITVEVVYTFGEPVGNVPSSIHLNFPPTFYPEDGEYIPLFYLPYGADARAWESLFLGGDDFECLQARAQVIENSDGRTEFGVLYGDRGCATGRPSLRPLIYGAGPFIWA